MTNNRSRENWLPHMITALGIAGSVLLWIVLLHNTQAYLSALFTMSSLLPWLALLIGISISFLVGAVIRITQVAKQRTVIVDQMNENLKREINERVQAEETKQKLEVALLQGQKLQAMGTLAGGIAHDFNNILYAIIGYVQLAQEDVSKDTLTHKNLGKVLEGAERGQELVARILAFSRRQHHDFDVLDTKSTIEAALSLLRPTIPASVIIQFEPEIDALILGNKTLLHQVLVNLINNAVDAMDGEGTITIHISRIETGDSFLRQFPGILQQNYCKIEISDTGHGMDQHTMERIFEPFFTTKEVGKGTGLGLSIVHSIVKEHQGEITVNSQLGHGTTFMILLPESPT